MSALTTVEVLRGTKTVLERNGWHQGALYDHAQANAGAAREECRVCLVGAFCVAATGDPVGRNLQTDAVWDLVCDLVNRRGTFGDSPIGDWNDEPDRTLAEVYALLDEAIERAEAGELR